VGVVGFEDNPNWMGYPLAWDGVDLIYEISHNKSCQLKKLLRINSEPSGSDEFIPYNFLMRSSHAKIFIGENREIRPWDGSPGDTSELNGTDAWISRSTASDDSEIRGATIETPRCWYTKTNGDVVSENVKVTFFIQPDGITVRATKLIPRSMVQAAMAEGVPLFADTTFRTDDVGSVGSDHTSVWKGGGYYGNVSPAIWATARGANGTASYDDYNGWMNCMVACSTTTDKYKEMRRMFMFFDTSALSGSVTDADFNWYHRGSENLDLPGVADHGVNIYGSTSTGTTNPANSDYQTFQTTPLATALSVYDDINLLLHHENTFTMNTAGKSYINTSGFSRFCFAWVDDIEDSEPTWDSNRWSYLNIFFSEADDTVVDRGPQLDVTTGAGSSLLHNTNSYMRLK